MCTCHESAVEFIDDDSLTMSSLPFLPAFPSIQLVIHFLFCDVFRFPCPHGRGHIRERSTPMLCSRHNHIRHGGGSCSVAIVGEKADESRNLGG